MRAPGWAVREEHPSCLLRRVPMGLNRRPEPGLEPHLPHGPSRLSSAIGLREPHSLCGPLCWAPGLGQGPSACIPRKPLSANVSGHTNTLVFGFKKRGAGDRDHHP